MYNNKKIKERNRRKDDIKLYCEKTFSITKHAIIYIELLTL